MTAVTDPATPDQDLRTQLAALRVPFPDEAVGKLPRSTCKACSDSPRKRCDNHTWVTRCPTCNGSHTSAAMHIDYVGHADVTARLLEVDPEWTWSPFTAADLAALPPMLRDAGLWINLTVAGVTRPGFGDADGKRGGNAVKEMIGDALRNAGMRFGIALDLWAKGDREWSRAEKDDVHRHPDEPQPRESTPPTPWKGPTTAKMLEDVDGYAGELGITFADITAVFRKHVGVGLDDIETVEAERMHPWYITVQAEVERRRADKAAAEAPEQARLKGTEQPQTTEPAAAGPDPWAKTLEGSNA